MQVLLGKESSMICLPYDLIAYVVQFLQDDPRTLHICASLSRMWHEVCRPQILQKVTIDVRKHTEDPLKRLESLLDQDPSITLLVREIRVSFLTSGRERGSSCEPWIYDLPRLLFKKLPGVQSLEIVGLGLPGDDFCPDFYQALQRLTSIKRLSLIYCCLLYDVLNSIIISFPNLEDLHIHGQWLAARLHGDDDFDLDRIPPLPRIPALKTFYYHNDDTSGPSTHAFLNWIKPIHSLRSIGIHVDSDAQLKQVAAFLRERGPHLEHLEIRFLSCADYWEWDNDSPVNMGEIARRAAIRDHFDLTPHRHLKTLHIHTASHLAGPFLLSQIAFLRPERIFLTDSVENLEICANSGDAQELDSVLTGRNYQYLPEVVFICRGRDNPCMGLIRKVFPKMCAQDKLRLLWSKRDTDLCCLL